MNKQTRSLIKLQLCTKVGKGINTGNDSGVSNALSNGALTFQPRPTVKGRIVDSHGEREKSGKKAYRGAGNPLGRD